MYTLYHHIICPFSRKIRFLLSQKEIEFDLVKENFWERKKEFLALNAAGRVPVLFDLHNQYPICGSSAIAEYIEEKHDDSKNYFGESLAQRAETRRLQAWFDEKFYNEVSKHFLQERFFNRLTGGGAPNPEILRLAKHNLNIH
ncbi:MAG: glutathione S-transferase, partial [Rickettsiales bacterium]